MKGQGLEFPLRIKCGLSLTHCLAFGGLKDRELGFHGFFWAAGIKGYFYSQSSQRIKSRYTPDFVFDICSLGSITLVICVRTVSDEVNARLTCANLEPKGRKRNHGLL